MTQRKVWISLVAVLLVGAGLAVTAARADDDRTSFIAILSGANEAEPVDTKARGVAFFQLSEDGTSLRFRLIVANIQDVMMAHIHLALPPAPAGGVVAWLYPAAPPPSLIAGRFQGVLADGVITAANLVGALAGMTMADLVHHIELGHTYVNVHTSAHPGGEIRGTIVPAD